MAVEFAMPKLGLTMESGTILRWLVPDATEVSAGDAVLLVETDKVETEIEASGTGVLHQTGEIGEEYLCGVRIGWFCEPGEDPPATAPSAAQSSPAAPSPADPPAAAAAAVAPVVRAPGERILASPAAKRLARELGVELAAIAGSGPKGRITERDVRTAAAAPTVGAPAAKSDTVPVRAPDAAPAQAPGPSPPATLAARQLADLLGVDLQAVRASAPDGRISRADVAVAVREMLARLSPTGKPEPPMTSSGAGAVAAAGAPSGLPVATGDPPAAASERVGEAVPLAQEPTELVPLRGMRGVIAERMSASLASMAQLTLTMEVDMSAVVAERAANSDSAMSDAGSSDTSTGDQAVSVPGYTDYVVAAAAAALRLHPRVNSQVTADAVALLGDVHIGLAVALDDGLLVPVIRHADRLSLGEIAAETTRLAQGARSGSLGYDDYQGATFTVTALGPFGVDAFTPIINAPNTAILGVGRIRDQAVWTDGTPEPRPVLTLSLTWDHRAFDGAPAARFAGAVRDWLESR